VQPKFILSPALAARLSLSDVDLASLFDMDLLRVVPASESNTCPTCGNHAADSYAQLLVSKPAEAPEEITGRHIVWCLCESVYSFAFVHGMDAQQLPGQARVRAASEAPTAAPVPAPAPHVPPLDAWAPVYDDHAVYRQRRVTSPMLWERLSLQQRSLVARTSIYRQNQATDLPPDS
jgi:hypothetical protein